METLYITFGTWILAIIIAMIAAANSGGRKELKIDKIL